ncbi:MAG TPA: helicase-associated domain-containing protein [Chloroflexia bacterium]|nr:helicase-associated domain-containing protein [Chloroflexia bacterium]
MKNLLGRLMSRPADELRAIAGVWGTVTRDPSPSQNDLAIAVYHTMVDPSAVRGVWENVGPDDRTFLTWLLGQRNMLAIVDDLPGLVDRPPDEVGAMLERVRRAGLVDVDDVMVRGSRVVSSGDNLYAWASRNQPEAVQRRVVSMATEIAKILRDLIEESKRPAPFDEPFSALLDRLEQADVQRIAASWKLPDAGRYYKSELIGVMSEFLATGQGKTVLLGSLSPASQTLFAFVESEGGRAGAHQIKRHFEWGEREFRAASLGLIQRALVWDVLEGDHRFLFIPSDVLKAGAGGPVKIAPYLQPKLDAPTPLTTQSRLPYELTWDLLTLLGNASQQELQLTLQDTRITKRLAKKVNDSFLQGEDLRAGTDYIDLVVHLAQSHGLLAPTGGEQPTLALTPRVEQWARQSFEAQRRTIFGLWQEDRKWTEPATYGTIYWWNSDMTGARKRLVSQLLKLPVGKWISLEGFLRTIHLTEPFIIWSQDELVRRYGLRALQGFRGHWFDIEGRIVADMLRTMLFWLGVVDLGKDKQKRFMSFRVTESGAALLDPTRLPSDTQPPPARALLVQPTFEVLVLHPESEVIWNLLRFADLVKHDRVSVYAINKESVLRAVEAGMTPRYILDFLQENTGKQLPQNVAQSIDDWARLIRYANVHRATLIEVEDPSIMDEMVASRKTKKYIVRRLSPTVAVAALPEMSDGARDDPWQRLMKELRAAGYVPRFTSEIYEPLADGPALQNVGSLTITGRNEMPRPGAERGTRKSGEPTTRRGTGRVKSGSTRAAAK